mgnify:CR=1 FL=1
MDGGFVWAGVDSKKNLVFDNILPGRDGYFHYLPANLRLYGHTCRRLDVADRSKKTRHVFACDSFGYNGNVPYLAGGFFVAVTAGR